MHLCSKVSHLSRSIRHGAALLKRLSLQPHIRKKFLSSASGLDAGLADKPVHQLEDSAVLQETCRKLDIPEPEFDFKYLCDPKNTETIRKNVHNRKGVGDIDKVVRTFIYLRYQICVLQNSWLKAKFQYFHFYFVLSHARYLCGQNYRRE